MQEQPYRISTKKSPVKVSRVDEPVYAGVELVDTGAIKAMHEGGDAQRQIGLVLTPLGQVCAEVFGHKGMNKTHMVPIEIVSLQDYLGHKAIPEDLAKEAAIVSENLRLSKGHDIRTGPRGMVTQQTHEKETYFTPADDCQHRKPIEASRVIGPGYESFAISSPYGKSYPCVNVQLVDTARIAELTKNPGIKDKFIGVLLSAQGNIAGEVFADMDGDHRYEPLEKIPVDMYLANKRLSDTYVSPALASEISIVSRNLTRFRGRIVTGPHGFIDPRSQEMEDRVIPGSEDAFRR